MLTNQLAQKLHSTIGTFLKVNNLIDRPFPCCSLHQNDLPLCQLANVSMSETTFLRAEMTVTMGW